MTTTTAKVEAGTPTGPEFVSTKGLRLMFGIPQSTAYELKAAGLIKSVCRRQPGKLIGRRLWDVQSVRDYYNSPACADRIEAERGGAKP